MTTDPKTIDNIGRSPQEQAAIAQVLRLGHEFGFGNLMHCLDREWAKMLKEKWSIGDGEHHWLGGNLSDASRVQELEAESDRAADLHAKSIESLMLIGKALGVPVLSYDESKIVAAAVELERKLAIAVEGLEWYANELNTHPNGAHMTPFADGKPDPSLPREDRGHIARSTLDKIKESK